MWTRSFVEKNVALNVTVGAGIDRGPLRYVAVNWTRIKMAAVTVYVSRTFPNVGLVFGSVLKHEPGPAWVGCDSLDIVSPLVIKLINEKISLTIN